MVLTRSPSKTKTIAISEEIRNYFSDPIKPLETTQTLEETFSLQKNRLDQLEIKCDENKQCSRRSSI